MEPNKVGRQITSYKERDHEKKYSISDMQLEHFNAMCQMKRTGDLYDFERAVKAFEYSLQGAKDDIYRQEIMVYMVEYEKLLEKVDKQDADLWFFDKKAESLCALSYRYNRGEIKYREVIDDSDIVREIALKMLNGIGQNVFITGAPGSGKSWSTGSLGEKVTRITGGKFSPYHVGFSLQHFMSIYNNIDLTPPGSCIALEEAGVNMNSKNAMSLMNKTFANVFQTLRHRKLLIILNAPDLSFLDKTPRKLLHWWFKTDKVNKKTEHVHLDPRVVEVNQQDGEIIYSWPRFDKTDCINELLISKPSKAFIDIYEPMQAEYKLKLARESEKTINELGDNKTLTEQELEYVNKRVDGTLQGDLMKEYRYSRDKATRIERQAREMGFIIPDNRGRNLRNAGLSAKQDSIISNGVQE